MQKFMKKRKARGFTLVELLIVIIIIGILSGALLLVAGAGTDKAEATKIVSNMRGFKTAALMIYADYGEWPSDGHKITTTDQTNTSFDEYMDQTLKDIDLEYTVESNDDGLYIKVAKADVDTGVAEKLDQMDESGLIVSTDYYMRIK